MAAGSPSKVVTGADIVSDARRYLGIPYVFGGGPQNPRAGLDCSGLVARVALDLGINNCPRTSEEQFTWVLKTDSPGPGDLVFFVGAPEEAGPPGHVGIVVTPGTMVDAPHTGTVVSIQHYAVNAQGEARVMGYGRMPRTSVSSTANPATGGLSPSESASVSTVGMFAGVGTVLALLVLGALIIGGFFVAGVMISH